jgi:O-acetyl-ADP-ribose deacetylase (regulator of RNase III)
VPSHLFKSSVSAALRRAAAVTDATGRVLRDSVAEELAAWTAAHSTRGRPVVAGTVVPTGAGALAAQGVRRLYHAALAVPRPGTNDYDVEPADVTRAVARGFALLAAEAGAFTPPLRSICFPLAGAGRGGLSPEASLAAVWTAVEAELARGAHWRVHLVVRRPANGDLVQRLLEARR